MLGGQYRQEFLEFSPGSTTSDDYGKFIASTSILRERSGSVVECLTRDRRAGGSSLNGVTSLWSLSNTHLS